MKQELKTVVVARCISCGEKREIKAYEVPAGELPECKQCYSPMVADSVRKVKRAEEKP